MANVTYLSSGASFIDQIKPLWEQLRHHLHCVSPYFKDYYNALTFQDRKHSILQRTIGGDVRVDLAFDKEALIGYCLSSVDRALTGEIDSILVDAKYRGQGIGKELMQRALAWLDSEGAKKKIISVTFGNEQVYDFYAKFGFLPRRTLLEQKT